MAQGPRAVPRPSGERVLLELEPPLAGALAHGQPLSAELFGPEGLVLLADVPGCSGFFAGSLGALALEEVFGHILTGIRSGLLVVQAGATRRTVTFRDAQVVFATSSERHERLGAVLVRLGLVTAAQLAAALAEVVPGRRVGQVLAAQGVLSEANLYSGMTFLVREVVVELFSTTQGGFLFLEGRLPTPDALKLPERTRELVLAGLRQAEAVARLRQRFPDTLRVQALPEAALPGEEALFERAARGASVGELRALFDGGLLGYLSWVDEQVRAGALVPVAADASAPAAGPVPAASLGVEERYNRLLAQVCRALVEVGKGPGVLRAFLAAPPPGLEGAFAGVSLSDEGRLDVERLRRNVSQGGAPLARALTFDALDAFAAYALFAARNLVPPPVGERLDEAYRALQEGHG